MGESISTIQHSPRISMSYKFAALAIGCRRWPCRRFKWASNLACQRHWKIAHSCRSPKDKVSARLHYQQRCLCTSRRDACERYPTAIQAVLKGRTVAIWKGNKHQLGLFFVLEACQRNAPRQADQRTQSFPFPIVIHQSLDPAARAIKHQAPCLYMHVHSSTLQAQNASTCRSTRRRGNHMHDHSRFQYDIDWRHRRLSLSTTHKSHSRTI